MRLNTHTTNTNITINTIVIIIIIIIININIMRYIYKMGKLTKRGSGCDWCCPNGQKYRNKPNINEVK